MFALNKDICRKQDLVKEALVPRLQMIKTLFEGNGKSLLTNSDQIASFIRHSKFVTVSSNSFNAAFISLVNRSYSSSSIKKHERWRLSGFHLFHPALN